MDENIALPVSGVPRHDAFLMPADIHRLKALTQGIGERACMGEQCLYIGGSSGMMCRYLRHAREYTTVGERGQVNKLELPGVDIHAFETLPSTQDYLLPLARQHPPRPILCVADFQTKGRGRGSKTWHAPLGATLCFSLCVRVHKPLHALGGMTLAFGVALCQTLEGLGAQGLGLKWPNDVHAPGGKLAGILTEAHAESADSSYLVVGVGLNLDVPVVSMAPVKTPWTDLRACLPPGYLIPRELLLARLVQGLLLAAELYASEGFAPFHPLYDARDCLKGQTLWVDGIKARVLGVSDAGELQIDRAPFRISGGEYRSEP